jgi:hypothetical protein
MKGAGPVAEPQPLSGRRRSGQGHEDTMTQSRTKLVWALFVLLRDLASWWQERHPAVLRRLVARLWENVIPQPDTKKFKLLNQKLNDGFCIVFFAISLRAKLSID